MITQTYRSDSNIARLKIIKKRIFYSNRYSNFSKYIPIEKLFNVKGFLRENKQWKGKPEEWVMEEGMKKWKRYLKKLGSEDKIARYLEEELMKQWGMSLIKEEKNDRI